MADRTELNSIKRYDFVLAGLLDCGEQHARQTHNESPGHGPGMRGLRYALPHDSPGTCNCVRRRTKINERYLLPMPAVHFRAASARSRASLPLRCGIEFAMHRRYAARDDKISLVYVRVTSQDVFTRVSSRDDGSRPTMRETTRRPRSITFTLMHLNTRVRKIARKKCREVT